MRFTSAQLEMLFQFGLFTGYSYFLQAPDESAFLANQFAQAGGSSAVFGGSYLATGSAGGEEEIVIPLPRKRVMRWRAVRLLQRMPKPLGIWVRFLFSPINPNRYFLLRLQEFLNNH